MCLQEEEGTGRQSAGQGGAAMRDGAVPHEDMVLFGATGPPRLLCPQHTLTLHLLGTVISGPGDHQGTFSLEKGLCPDCPPREKASRRQPKSSGTVHQPGLQSPPQPISRGRGHRRRPLWVVSVGLDREGFPLLEPQAQGSKHFQETRTGSSSNFSPPRSTSQHTPQLIPHCPPHHPYPPDMCKNLEQ